MVSNISQKGKIVFLFSGLLLFIVLISGIIGGVGWWSILKRILLYVPIFGFWIFLIMFLSSMWGKDAELENPSLEVSKAQPTRKKKGENQASNLGKSLDIKDSIESPRLPLEVEPEKAAKAIRQMLSEDKQ